VPRPRSLRLRNVKVPVTDLGVALEWYSRVLEFRPTIEFRDSDGVMRGVHGDLPGISAGLALREDPEAAQGLGTFAIANFEVADRSALEQWTAHLDAVGAPHDPIVDTPRLSVLIFSNPDGQEVHLYTPIRG
jgi:catechol-2,3-dioxygenase